MRKAPHPDAPPGRLTRRDLALTVPAHMRHLPAHVIEAEMSRRRRMLEQFDWRRPRRMRRLGHYVLGAVIFLPLFSWFLTPVGFTRLWLQIPLAAAFGAVLCLTRVSDISSILLCLLYGAVHYFVVGGMPFSFFSPGLYIMLVTTVLFWVVLGWALGTAEDLSRCDGD